MNFPNSPNEFDLAFRLHQVEKELQRLRHQKEDAEKAQIKQMSNRELLEAIYLKLLDNGRE